jgi:hypothetical protein
MRALLLGLLLAACTYEVRPQQAPADVHERHEAEADACWRGDLPPWLDDAALSGAARLDAREAQAARANDSYRGATYTSLPQASGRGPRVAALLDERRLFQQQCALLRSGGKDFGAR